ncbi:hypothetical protein PanWU01x14_198020, partial [Parasponia andersonii]
TSTRHFYSCPALRAGSELGACRAILKKIEKKLFTAGLGRSVSISGRLVL